MQNRNTMEAFSLLRKMHFSKMINQTVKNAIRVRLELLLEHEIRQHQYWTETVRHKLNATRQKQIEREFNKRIQAMKIVIHTLTPYYERETTEIPTFIKKKYVRNSDNMG